MRENVINNSSELLKCESKFIVHHKLDPISAGVCFFLSKY